MQGMKRRTTALPGLEWGPEMEATRALMGIRMEMVDRKLAWRVRQLGFPNMRIGFVKRNKLQGGLYAWKVIKERYVASHKYFPAPNGSIRLNQQPAGVTGAKSRTFGICATPAYGVTWNGPCSAPSR